MKKVWGIICLALALSGCAALQGLENSALTPTQVYVAANAFDAAELTATNYLNLPACVKGGSAVCRNPAAVPSLVSIIRGGYQARRTLVAACSASTTATTCVSAYTTVTTAVSGLQTIFAQYSITKG
jgi:hypothetical protein